MTMNGIDVSSWQAGIDLSRVPCDFVICKATGGAGYVNPDCDRAYQQAKGLGKKLGVYHFAREAGCEGSAVDEAAWFVSNIKGYIGEAILVLDWEASAVGLGVGWAKAWLDEVQRLTGVKPLLYSYNNCVNSYDWSSVANADYGLWNAGYYAYGTPMGYNPDAPLIGGTGAWAGAAMYQYTSEGRLDGWNGNLDLNVFYGDAAAWDAYAGAVAPIPVEKNLAEAGIADVPNQAYTGEPVCPELVSSAGASFDTRYEFNTSVGWATVIATGRDGWTGEVRKSFKILPESLCPYQDIDPAAWYLEPVLAAVEGDYMTGCSDGVFAPDDAITRAAAVCAIYKHAGYTGDPLPYCDVERAPWYHDAIEWATARRIVSGNNGEFRPNDAATREELCVMLHNEAGNPLAESMPANYCDWPSVSDWARNAVAWAVEAGVIGGNEGLLRPADACTRAEAAAMLERV